MSKEKISLKLEVDILPLNYPKLLLKRITDLTGRPFKSQNLKKKITGIDIWCALRLIYSHFIFSQPGFKYQENFRWPENYSIDETLEHLRMMLKIFLDFLFKQNNNLSWQHLAKCNFHFDIFKALIFSFIEAVQRREFGNRFDERLVKIEEKYANELLKKIVGEAKKRGYLKEVAPFTKDQRKMLIRYFKDWGSDKTNEFNKNFIIPKLEENNLNYKFSDQELLSLIALFENSYLK